MCVVSMIYDMYRDKPKDFWKPVPPKEYDFSEEIAKKWQESQLDQKIKELEELLQKAREYDKKMNQPDCEMDEKRLALKKIADELGVEIKFI